MSTYTNPWELLATEQDDADYRLDDERERWATLVDEPLNFVRNPFKYGPLTVDGYISARTSHSLRNRKGWPTDPAAIAALLVKCGVDRKEAGFAAIAHESEVDSNVESPTAHLLGIHLSILSQLKVTPNKDDLKSALRDYDWSYSYYQDYEASFNVMKDYLPTVAEQEAFLNEWLPELTASQHAFNVDESVGLALAAGFPSVDPASIIEWCKNNDDQVGLGYLVCQKRFTFGEWLAEVAEPSGGTRKRGDSEDYMHRSILRRNEQLETLVNIMKYTPHETLRAEGEIFYRDHPEKVEQLTERLFTNPAQDSKVIWCMELINMHVIPADHPVVNKWIDAAFADQDTFIAKLANGKVSYESLELPYLYNELHYNYGPKSVAFGEKFQTYLARDIILRCRPNERDMYILKMPDTEWLKGLAIAEAFNARVIAGHNNSLDLMTAFYPFAPADTRKEFAMVMFDAAVKKPDLAYSIGVTLKTIDEERFNTRDVSLHSPLWLLMYQLTHKDPIELFDTMLSLEIGENDPLYVEMMRQWLQKNVQETAPTLALPQDMGNEMLGVFGQVNNDFSL